MLVLSSLRVKLSIRKGKKKKWSWTGYFGKRSWVLQAAKCCCIMGWFGLCYLVSLSVLTGTHLAPFFCCFLLYLLFYVFFKKEIGQDWVSQNCYMFLFGSAKTSYPWTVWWTIKSFRHGFFSLRTCQFVKLEKTQ